MANKNLDQIYTANPITTNASTDLMYFMQSPYSSGTDAGMLFSDFAAQFGSGTVTSITAGTGLSGGTITTSGTIALNTISGLRLLSNNSGSPAIPVANTLSSFIDASVGNTTQGGLLTRQSANWLSLLPSATSGTLLQSRGTGANLAYSTSSFPTGAIAINSILFASAANTVTGLAPVNKGFLTSNATGVPTWLTSSADGQIVIASASGAPALGTITAGTGITVTNAANSITIAASGGASPWTAGVGASSAYGGGATSPTGAYSLVWGNGATAGAATNALVFGENASTSANYTYAIGQNSGVSGVHGIAIGNSANAVTHGIAIGYSTTSSAYGAVVIGEGHVGGGIYSTCLGYSCTSHHTGSMILGDSNATGNTDSANDQFVSTFAGGFYNYIGSTLAYKLDPNFSLAIGNGGTSAGGSVNAFAFGNNAVTGNDYSFAMGTGARAGGGAGGGYGFAFGNSCNANGLHCLAIGNQAITTNAGSWVIGDGNSTPQTDTAANQFAASFAGGFKLYTGDLSVATVGKGLQVKEGSNAKQGIATLVGGTVTVSNTSVTASSRIFLTTQNPGGTVGAPYISARTAGTSFAITSTSTLDTSDVAYEIFEPS